MQLQPYVSAMWPFNQKQKARNSIARQLWDSAISKWRGMQYPDCKRIAIYRQGDDTSQTSLLQDYIYLTACLQRGRRLPSISRGREQIISSSDKKNGAELVWDYLDEQYEQHSQPADLVKLVGALYESTYRYLLSSEKLLTVLGLPVPTSSEPLERWHWVSEVHSYAADAQQAVRRWLSFRERSAPDQLLTFLKTVSVYVDEVPYDGYHQAYVASRGSDVEESLSKKLLQAFSQHLVQQHNRTALKLLSYQLGCMKELDTEQLQQHELRFKQTARATHGWMFQRLHRELEPISIEDIDALYKGNIELGPYFWLGMREAFSIRKHVAGEAYELLAALVDQEVTPKVPPTNDSSSPSAILEDLYASLNDGPVESRESGTFTT